MLDPVLEESANSNPCKWGYCLTHADTGCLAKGSQIAGITYTESDIDG